MSLCVIPDIEIKADRRYPAGGASDPDAWLFKKLTATSGAPCRVRICPLMAGIPFSRKDKSGMERPTQSLDVGRRKVELAASYYKSSMFLSIAKVKKPD